MKILVLNAGSSSQKSRLYELPGTGKLPAVAPTPLWQADADWTDHQGTAELKISTSSGAVIQENLPTDARTEVISGRADRSDFAHAPDPLEWKDASNRSSFGN